MAFLVFGLLGFRLFAISAWWTCPDIQHSYSYFPDDTKEQIDLQPSTRSSTNLGECTQSFSPVDVLLALFPGYREGKG